jgi:hypothetical protein
MGNNLKKISLLELIGQIINEFPRSAQENRITGWGWGACSWVACLTLANFIA